MERAKRMLASGRSVTEVCFEVGYGSLGSFSSKFRTRFGRSPIHFSAMAVAFSDTAPPGGVLMAPRCFCRFGQAFK